MNAKPKTLISKKAFIQHLEQATGLTSPSSLTTDQVKVDAWHAAHKAHIDAGCPTCTGRLATRRWERNLKHPSLQTMERWSCDGVAKALDGCRVEPDGTCKHGMPSWLLYLGHC